jgi:hypothetical protein
LPPAPTTGREYGSHLAHRAVVVLHPDLNIEVHVRRCSALPLTHDRCAVRREDGV